MNMADVSARTSVDDCRIVELPQIVRPQGRLTPVEGGRDVPFSVERVYYLYDVPGGEARGGHAHRQLQQLIVSVMGSFDLVLDDGERRRSITLAHPRLGVYVPRLIWRELVSFSTGGICLVLASLPYDETEYVRDYAEFLAMKQS